MGKGPIQRRTWLVQMEDVVQRCGLSVQYVDDFYARMELVKKGASAWNGANCEQSLHGKIHAALDRRIDFYATESSLRESLSAQGLDTQLSRAKLQIFEGKCFLKPPSW